MPYNVGMHGERGFVAHLHEMAINFISGDTLVHPNSYILQEETLNVPTHFDAFVSLFPSMLPGDEGTFAVTDASSGQSGISILNRVTKLELPQRLKDLKMQNDPGIRSAAETVARLQGFPVIVLVFGITRDTNKEVAYLFCLPGMTPESALSQIQDRARRKLASLN